MLLSRRYGLWDIDKAFDEMNRLFGAFAGPSGLRTVPTGTLPAVSLYDRGDDIIMVADLPGVDGKDIDLNVVENTVTLTGSRDADKKNGHRYYRRERPAGQFKRTITLGEKVDPAKVTAELKNGVLTVTMPKARKTEPKKITVKAD